MKKTLLQIIYDNPGITPLRLLDLLRHKEDRIVPLFEMFNVLTTLQLDDLVVRLEDFTTGETRYYHWYHTPRRKLDRMSMQSKEAF